MPRPAISVTLDGVDLTARLRPVLSSVRISEARDNDADELELVLVDRRGTTPLPPKGAVIAVSMGYEGQQLVAKGSFRLDQRSLSGFPGVMTLKARSADFTAQLRTRRDQTWNATTLGQVLGEVAGRQGVTAEVDPTLAAIQVPVLDQSRESDGALLRRLGKRYDAVATIKAGRLLFSPIGKGATPSGAMLPAFEIRRRDGDQYAWDEVDRDRYEGVEARWHDVGEAKTQTVRVGAEDGETDAKHKRLKRIYGSEADARAAAQAEANRINRGAATFRYSLAVGRPELYPEQKGRISGFGRAEIDDATWVIARAEHSWSDASLTTDLDLETA